MQDVLVNRLGRLSLRLKSVVRLTDRPDMTLDVYRGRKTTTTTTKSLDPFYQTVLMRGQYTLSFRNREVFFLIILNTPSYQVSLVICIIRFLSLENNGITSELQGPRL